MKIIGDPIFAKDESGKLKSRIGTIFFKTPGLVTQRGIHAMQRMTWIRTLNEERAAAGKPALTEAEEEAELADSADLIFTEEHVLIRPDPNRMDLALKADEALQSLVSKRKIRFLNTHAAKVRDALRARGENWRMARRPESPEDIERAIESAHGAIQNEAVYYYNGQTGTRHLTVGGYVKVASLPPDAFRAQIVEIVGGLKGHNRLGQPEIALFPSSLPPDVADAFRAISPEALDDAALRAAVEAAVTKWRVALPANLREESVANFDWRNEMSFTLTRGPNETNIGDQELIQGISPEFYRQIEWLPGGRIEDGQLLFDSLYDEAALTQDPALLELCDSRVRSIIFNLVRLFSTVEYVNVGRIARSLARRPVAGSRRGNVYIVQYRERGETADRVLVLRFQKWGIAERLDEGKDLLRAILESNEYGDYILDRRLACRQLGMNLPRHVGFGRITEKYRGANVQYVGTAACAFYYVRAYVPGVASDKVPPERFRNPAFAQGFAYLMGQAAAVDMVVGRAATETGEPLFDTNYEVVRCGADGLPQEIVVTEQTGTFVKYQEPYDELVGAYANVVRRRVRFMGDADAFAKAYVTGFERRLAEIQSFYRARRRAFDELFLQRPYDTAGSGAFRWSCVLKRLDACDPAAVAELLRKAIQA